MKVENMDTLGSKPESMSQVEGETECLGRMIMNISEVLDRLEEKLFPILREAPKTPETLKEVTEMKRVPLAAELNSLYCQTETLRDRLEDILGRVEV